MLYKGDGITCEDFINSGVASAMCGYYAERGGTPIALAATREYAIREFRDAKYEVILQLMDVVKDAYAKAQQLNIRKD